ncbi:3'-5' exonuclease [Pseudomonas aeruginosa]|uniref:3'-5' exonuclease n=1 Tax=Pseudomonas aeruginosa TaxID=287 RepID=UPI000E6859CB|nr:3'-5' exonuclease [Pseudomonas aeruginosa]MBA5107692.1 ATP-binding domain-containing protein [Pseudomonas aeruginosa]MBD1300143.1 ATP-binding domain-containing protein [Pseudomonas aeruginosa]MBD1340708.1 ATP-binding domain-containing protein [Pseudomonas aeruginosa]MBG4604281.1 ATP-binding domain-containing protein [Pseudomonas aeruginosa]MBH3592844.1 ATP-binding domain-containing protein [Pseudomonas aeruginosa]
MHSPTEEQATIAKAAVQLLERPRGIIKSVAGAGCGKTTTLHTSAQECYEAGARRLCYLAYNKPLVDDGKQRFGNLANVSTFNGMAFNATGAKNSGRKTANLHPSTIEQAFDLKNKRLPLDAGQFSRVVLQTLSAYCNSSSTSITSSHLPAWVKDQVVGGLAVQYADVLFQAIRVGQNTVLPLSHDVILKEWHLQGSPGLSSFDLILLDECQDLSAVHLGCLAYAKRALVVGDAGQQLYPYRGAQDTMLKIPGAGYPLSLSFRFGPAIATLANAILQTKTSPPPLRLRGLAGKETRVGRLSYGASHTKIFRHNVSIARDAMVLADLRTPFAIVGDMQDLGEKISSAHALMQRNHRDIRHPAYAQFRNWGEFEDWAAENPDSEVSQAGMLALEYAERVDDLTKILSGAGQSRQPEVTLTGIYRAKGREWPNVVIAPDFDHRLEALVRRGQGSKLDEELNLLYVGVTRVKSLLESQSKFLDRLLM